MSKHLKSQFTFVFNMKLFSSKRGVEIWVSWVLLTAMVLILSIFMYNFMVRYTQTHASETVEIVTNNQNCEAVAFRIISVCKEDSVDFTGLQFELENTKDLNIDALLLRFYDESFDLMNSSEYNLTDDKVTFKAGQKKYLKYNLTSDEFEDVFLVQLLPEISSVSENPDDIIICDARKVEYKNITSC